MNSHTGSAKGNRLFKVLISIGLIVLLVAFSAGILLKKGIELDTIAVGRVIASDFSLLWKDKLELQIGTVAITEKNGGTGSSNDLTFARKGVSLTRYLAKLFSKVVIREIRVGELLGTVNLQQNASPGVSYLSLSSDDLVFRSNLAFEQGTLVVDVKEAGSKRFNSRATGQFRLDIDRELITGTLLANISGSLPITVEFSADSEKLSFKGKEAGEIRTITPLVDMFGLSQNIQRWITDYLKGSRYNLTTFSGDLAWHTPGAILETLYAEVRVDDCQYTFAPGLEPIKTHYTDVVFKKGILTITPHESTFCGQKAEGSWVDIDFNDPANIILTPHIKTHAMANADILALLNYYKILLPFKQTEGNIATDLILTINLNKLEVDARGTLLIDEGVVEYKQNKFDVKNGKITLKNSDVTIEQIAVSFKEQFAATISGVIDAGKGTGELDISLEQCDFQYGKSTLNLDHSKNSPTVKFHIRSDGYLVDASGSSWEKDGLKFSLGSFGSSYSFDELSWVFPPVQLDVSSDILVEISGSFSATKKKAKIQCEIEKFYMKDIVLEDPKMSIAIEYDQEWIILDNEISRWRLNNISTSFYPAEIKYKNNVLTVANRRISYGKFFDSEVSGQYNISTKKGDFLLGNIHVKNKNIGELVGVEDSVIIEVSREKDSVVIKAPELDLNISTDRNKNWSASIGDLSAVHKRSKVLQQYMLDTGSIKVSQDSTHNTFDFFADILYRYPILAKDNTPVDHFVISGTLSDQDLNAVVNDDLQIHYGADRLAVTSRDLGYNIPAILELIENFPRPESSDLREDSTFSYTLEAINSSLFFKQHRQAIADKIDLKSVDKKVDILLQHGSGNIVLEAEGGEFLLQGKDLSDSFMNNLIEGAKFQNGTMNITAKGSFDTFSALFEINDTVLRELKAVNNIMAFLDTIPALITFSLPNYNSKGLPISSAVAGMRVTNGLVSFESLEVKSPALSMAGTGWIDIAKNQIDMDLNLITGAKANLNKVPMLGYIVVGKEKKPSITVKITGDLQNPKVDNSMFHGVVTKPASILYRTLSLPLHLVDSVRGSPEGEREHSKENTSDAAEKNKDN